MTEDAKNSGRRNEAGSNPGSNSDLSPGPVTEAETRNVSEMMGAAEQAGHHTRARDARQTEIVEDYVELIADLIDTYGEARAVELAKRVGVSQPRVGKMISRLQEAGLVTSEPYRAIFLTEEGRKLAEWSRVRHQVLLDFLRAVGVSEDAARRDSEGMEHHVSAETFAVFRRFLEQRRRAQD